ncbi:MAG: COX15/CtaA family protein [Proteobacteria bacterium]|nr:COX15/CtaA family protein [Pseudomonadota bacterium]
MTVESEIVRTGSTIKSRKLILGWLVLMVVLVFSMIVLGGVTRLTNSGLSMTDWKPITGWLPPLSQEAWQAEFDRYKAFPEYQQINKGMSLDEFKGIYAFEFAHRVLGRVIGIVFFVPFALFLIFAKIRGPLTYRLGLLFVLGGLQGGMGWFMVKSGLVDDPDVSHYRLTAHLALASLIFAVILWTIFDLTRSPSVARASEKAVRQLAWAILGLVALQILIGGFVAGLNAGFVYNDWPMMGGDFLPEDMMYMTPWYLNFLENPGAVQFTHRIVAYVLLAMAALLYLVSRRQDIRYEVRLGCVIVLIALIVQAVIGIVTLLFVVPVSLGALHQAGGMVVLAVCLYVAHSLTTGNITIKSGQRES